MSEPLQPTEDNTSTAPTQQSQKEEDQKNNTPGDHQNIQDNPNTYPTNDAEEQLIEPPYSIEEMRETLEGTSAPPIPLEGEALKEALQDKIEQIFTKEYLSTDPSLVSKMNSTELSVSVDVIAGLQPIQSLTEDTDLILHVLRTSSKVIFDEANRLVKPSFKINQRNTIILRDIPATVDPEKIRALFDDPKYQVKISDVRADVGDTWFVTFEDEEVTTDAFFYVRQKSFDGKLVQGRIKSENLLKSFTAPQPPITPYYQMYPIPNSNGPINHTRYANTWMPPSGRGKGGRYARGGRRKKSNRGGESIYEKNSTEKGDDARRNPRVRKGRKGPRGQNNPIHLGPSNFPPLPTRGNSRQSTGIVENLESNVPETNTEGVELYKHPNSGKTELTEKKKEVKKS